MLINKAEILKYSSQMVSKNNNSIQYQINIFLALVLVISFNGLIPLKSLPDSSVLGIQDTSIPYQKVKNDHSVDILHIDYISSTSNQDKLTTEIYSAEQISIKNSIQENTVDLALKESNEDFYIYKLSIQPTHEDAYAKDIVFKDQVGNTHKQFFFLNVDKPVITKTTQDTSFYGIDPLLFPLSKYNCFENTDLIQKITRTTIQDNEKTFWVEQETSQFLIELLEQAREDEIDIYINSAYRSVIDQLKILKINQRSLGTQKSDNLIAYPLCSEHHLGTAIDFTVPEVRNKGTLYQNTKAYKWLRENAHLYGFINSYPQNNKAGFAFEPWHWRYIGIDLASTYKLIDHHKDPYEFLLLISQAE